MELTKNIFFNTDKLVENAVVKVSYTGKLFEENADEVYLHYGFGINWDNVDEQKMTKTELGFQAEIQLQSSETLNFCFRDSNDNWDNNNTENYIFPIEKQEQALVLQQENMFFAPARRLRKTYIWSKKIRLAVYKIITYVPRIISGNYKRKLNEN